MITPAPGILLIAEPFLKDPNFMRTVILLCEHQKEGSFGFVLNRKHDYLLNDLMNDLDHLPLPVFYGGPVRTDTLHFIHRFPDEIPGGQEIFTNTFWGGDFEAAIRLLESGTIDQNQIRFFTGYSGWSQGQLEEELEGKSWLTVKANRKIVFHPDEAAIWKEALHLLGGAYTQLIHYPIDPQLN